MIKNLESEKAKLKAQLNQEIDEYFEKFETSSNEEDFNINKIDVSQNRKI